jgi:hypothetical protein
LSRRTVIFINNQAYFRCHQRILSEATWADSRRTGYRDKEMGDTLLGAMQEYYDQGYDTEDDEVDTVLDCFFAVIETYQRRNLTKDSDAINAVMGILRPAASRLMTHLLEGLPIEMFDLALLFVTAGFWETEFQKDTQVRRRLEFPSWSWAGWVANLSWASYMSVTYDKKFVEDWLMNKTWIIWYKFQHGHSVQPVWALEEKGPFNQLWEDMIHERNDKRHPRNQFSNLNTARTSPSKCYLIKPYALLQFFTVSIRLKIRYHDREGFDHEYNGGSPLISLHDSKDTFCGSLYPDIPECTVNGQQVELIIPVLPTGRTTQAETPKPGLVRPAW